MQEDNIYRTMDIIITSLRDDMYALLSQVGSNDVIVNMDISNKWYLEIAHDSSFLETFLDIFHYDYSDNAVEEDGKAVSGCYVVHFNNRTYKEIYDILNDNKRNILLQQECRLLINALK